MIVLIVLLALLIAPPIFYFVWMKRISKKSWMLKVNSDYTPTVSLIVSTYNEALVINKKLMNIQKMDYPVDKLEVIIVDSASTDNTLNVCSDFLKNSHFRFPIRLISEEKRLGKSHALNTAMNYAVGEIIATSDADSIWESNALRTAVSFFADESVGAVTGKEKLVNLEESVHTLSEGLYRNFYYTLRLGESKIHSTLIFQGELALYKHIILDKFEDRPGYADDTGTIINIISKGYRCIFVPEAVFQDVAAFTMKGRLTLKSRRAEHLIAGILQASKYKINGKINLHSAVIAFNFYIHVLSPFILVAAVLVFLTLIVVAPWFAIMLVPLLCILSLKKARLFVISYLTSNIALANGLFRHFFMKKKVTWKKIDEMRRK
jgi:cellulose synthase/poly-beta-1,6-N-acetylglucosamine synthase-like glycosyltransferase